MHQEAARELFYGDDIFVLSFNFDEGVHQKSLEEGKDGSEDAVSPDVESERSYLGDLPNICE